MSSPSISISRQTSFRLYRSPMEIMAMDRPDIEVRDLTTEKVSVVYTSRLQLFRHPAEMTPEELEVQVLMSMNILSKAL